MEYCWAFIIMKWWFTKLVIGVYEWLYKSMVYGISYVYEWFMFMNGCISQLNGISYLCLEMVLWMDITWSNDLVALEIE